MKYKLIIAMLLISLGARSQTSWTGVGNGLQQRVVAGKTEYRFTKITPYPPYGLTDSLNLKANTNGNNSTGTWPISITGNSTGLQSSFNSIAYDGRFKSTTPFAIYGTSDDGINTFTPNAVKTYLGLQNVSNLSDTSFIKNNKTNTPEAKRISVSDSIKTAGVTTFSESNLYGTVDRTVNYERLRNYFSNNIFNINTENGGSGAKRILSIGIGGLPALPTSDASQSYTLFNTNPAIVGAASGYGVTTVKVGLNQPGVIGSQVFTKASLTSSVTGQGIVGGGFSTFLGASNTFNWTTLSNQHPNIQGLSSVVGQSVGATGSIPKVASVFGTITGGGAIISEANLLNLTYGHVGTITSAVGARITDVNAGTNNTFLLMNLGDATAPPTGNYGIYGDYSYNNYLGTGNTLIGSSTNNGGELQVFHGAIDALPGFVLDGNQSIGGKQISFKNIGVEYGYIDNNGRLFGSGISNYGSLNNSSFNTTANGAIASRNIADAGKAFVARQINSGSTGDIFDAQFINPAGSKFKIDYRGVIGVNGTLLSALQSLRTNAAGTASEAFIAADDSGVVHKSGAETITGSKSFTGSLNAVGISLTGNLSNTGATQLVGKASSAFTPVDPTDISNKASVDAGLALKPNLGSSNVYTAGSNTFPNAGLVIGSNTAIGYSIISNSGIGVQDLTNSRSAAIAQSGFTIINSTGTLNIGLGSLTTTRNVTYGDASGTVQLSADGITTLDFPNTVSNNNSVLTVSVTGASLGDVVVLGLPANVIPASTWNGSFQAWVSSINTVSVMFSNNDPLNPHDIASGSFKIKILK